MSKYLRCLLALWLYFLCSEALVLMISVMPFPGAIGMLTLWFFNPLPIVVALLITLIMAYLFCVLLSRSDATTTLHQVHFSFYLALLVALLKATCALSLGYDWSLLLWLVVLTVIEFTLAGWLYAKLQ